LKGLDFGFDLAVGKGGGGRYLGQTLSLFLSNPLLINPTKYKFIMAWHLKGEVSRSNPLSLSTPLLINPTKIIFQKFFDLALVFKRGSNPFHL